MPIEIVCEEVTYGCPNCQTQNKPYMYNANGIAFMICSNCKREYKTSTRRSANFRLLSSKVGRQPNRYSGYYTSAEKKVKRELDKRGLREGYDYIHNVRIKNPKGYYWLDFLIIIFKPFRVLAVSPRIWHKIGNRAKSEALEKEFIERLGMKYIDLKDKVLNNNALLSMVIDSIIKRRE